MKKTVITFGLISGAIVSALMLATIPFIEQIGFENGAVVGYTTMVLAFMLVFFGIRSYRDNVGGGKITFGRAFSVGILITLISCACYVLTWEIIYYNFMPDFMDKYAAYSMDRLKTSGASKEIMDAQLQQFTSMKELYRNPFFNVAITFIEPLPVGMLVTLLSAGILRKRGKG